MKVIDRDYPEDGYEVVYKSNTCMCVADCNEDDLELYEGGDDIPYRLEILGTEMKDLIKGLLDGTVEVTKYE